MLLVVENQQSISIYMSILRGELDNTQYQYLEGGKTILSPSFHRALIQGHTVFLHKEYKRIAHHGIYPQCIHKAPATVVVSKQGCGVFEDNCNYLII